MHRGRAWILVGALAALVGLGIWAMWQLHEAQADVRGGLAELTAVRAGGTDQLLQPPTAAHLAAAEQRFGDAQARTSDPVLRALGPVPLLGRQVRSAQALAGTAYVVAGTARQVQAIGAQVAAAGTPEGPERVAALRKVGAAGREAATRFRGVSLGPKGALLPPLARARARAEDELARMIDFLGPFGGAAEATADLLDQPHDVLVLVGNNAEMRSGGGTLLSYGFLRTGGGHLALDGPVRSTGTLPSPDPAPPADPDVAALWPVADASRVWTNLNVTPRFDATAKTAVAMAQAVLGRHVDDVLYVDPVLLQSLVAATGPVTAGGRQLDAAGVLGFLLHDQYTGLGPDGQDPRAQAERRDALADLAGTVLGRLGAALRPTAALRPVALAAEGRHVMAWSARPEQEVRWVAAGLSGQVDRDTVLLSLLNTGANKLDPYQDVTASLGVEGRRLAVDVEVRSRATTSDLPYVLGRTLERATPGRYDGILALSLPGGCRDVATEGGAVRTQGPDGPTTVVGLDVSVPPGGRTSVRISCTLPSDLESIRVTPSARVPGVRWRAGSRTWTDEHVVRLKV